MKRYIKIFFAITILAGIMFIFSGCAYYDTNFDFEFNSEYMSDKYVDLLIPFDETDERYTDFNCIINRSAKDPIRNFTIDVPESIPENSRIVSYDNDGFRSMLMHMKDASLDIMIKDSEGIPDYNEKYNGTPYTVSQHIGLPNEWLRKYDDPYGTEAFLEFCNKYKKCRVAIFDKDGNVLQISKKIPLVSLGNFYINDTTFYDIEKNRIKPHYIMSAEMLAFSVIVWLLMQVGVIGCIITLIVDKINQNKTIVSYMGYIIASSIFNIPTALFILICIYSAFGLSTTVAGFFINLLAVLLTLNIGLIGIPITIGVLVHFINFEKRHRKRIRKQEEFDISEQM